MSTRTPAVDVETSEDTRLPPDTRGRLRFLIRAELDDPDPTGTKLTDEELTAILLRLRNAHSSGGYGGGGYGGTD